MSGGGWATEVHSGGGGGIESDDTIGSLLSMDGSYGYAI